MHTKHSMSGLSYADRMALYMNDHYVYGDSFSYYLNLLGNDAHEIIYNEQDMQLQWARENGIKSSNIFDILKVQIHEIKPDVIFWDGMEDYQFVHHIKELYPSIKVHFSQIGVPINNISRFLPYDFVITCLKQHVDELKNNGIDAYFVKHGFDARIISKLKSADNREKFTFAGSIYSGADAHMKRALYIEYLMKHTDLHVYTAFRNPSFSDIQKHIIKKTLSSMIPAFMFKGKTTIEERISSWRNAPHPISISSELAGNLREPVFGIDMFNVLMNSEVTLNVHIDIAQSYAASIRLYEATGVGTCLLTDYKDDIEEYFKPDYEILTFKNNEEAAEKFNYIMEHENERQNIADRGMKRTLSEHNMNNRINDINAIIAEYL